MWPHHRFIGIYNNLRRKKINRTDQGSNFLGGSFSNRKNLKAPIQFRTGSEPKYLKRLFFLKNRPIYFHINSTTVIRPDKRNQLRCLITVKVENDIRIDTNITDNIIRKVIMYGRNSLGPRMEP